MDVLSYQPHSEKYSSFPAPTLSGAMSASGKPVFKNVLAWSFLNSVPAQALIPGNQIKTNNNAIHNSNKPASRGLNEPAAGSPMAPSGRVSSDSSEREPMNGSVSDGRYRGRGNSQGRPMILASALAAS
jgi:hypothetical protein